MNSMRFTYSFTTPYRCIIYISIQHNNSTLDARRENQNCASSIHYISLKFTLPCAHCGRAVHFTFCFQRVKHTNSCMTVAGLPSATLNIVDAQHISSPMIRDRCRLRYGFSPHPSILYEIARFAPQSISAVTSIVSHNYTTLSSF